MTARTQTLVLTLLGAVGIKLVLTGSYLRYVNPYMKWPVLTVSALLLVLSLRHLFAEESPEHEHARAPRAAWALLLPVFVVFIISPPALGAYVAERRPVTNVPQPDDPSAIPPLPKTSTVKMQIIEFDTRAKWDKRDSLKGRRVQLMGFVTGPKSGPWELTRLSTTCCAADAISWHVRIQGAPRPTGDGWVRVTGVWRDPGTAVPRRGAQILEAESVVPITPPVRPYM